MSYEFLNGTGHRSGLQTRNSCNQEISALPGLQGARPTRFLDFGQIDGCTPELLGAPNPSLADYTRVCKLCAAYVGTASKGLAVALAFPAQCGLRVGRQERHLLCWRLPSWRSSALTQKQTSSARAGIWGVAELGSSCFEAR